VHTAVQLMPSSTFAITATEENERLRAQLETQVEELRREKAAAAAAAAAALLDAEKRLYNVHRDETERLARRAQEQFREKLVWKQSSESWYDAYQSAKKSCTAVRAVREPAHFSQWFGGVGGGGGRGIGGGGGVPHVSGA